MMHGEWKRKLYLAVLLLLTSLLPACGLREKPGSASGVGEDVKGSSVTEEGNSETEDGMVAVADYTYLSLDIPLLDSYGSNAYVLNGEWLYYAVPTEGEDGKYYNHIARYRIADGFREEDYITLDRPMDAFWIIEMLADKEGNCYLFSGPFHVKGLMLSDSSQEEDVEDENYYLEKYGPEGDLLWQSVFTAEELQGKGMRLRQGTVTEDGRVFLSSFGEDGVVYAFGPEGKLEEVCTPELDSLDGIAAGREGRMYVFCAKGEETVFAQLGEEGTYTPPVVPLAVYDGYGEGLFLRTGEGLWRYVPETGETERLWGWNDAYVQADGSQVLCLAQGGEGIMLMCAEQTSRLSTEREVLTFASVSFREKKDYPGKQTVTLACRFEGEVGNLVRRYNRQSRKYQVEVVQEYDSNVLIKQLLKGEAADIIRLSGFYFRELAEIGAFEELTPYYEASEAVDWEDILEPVREACLIDGQNVVVIPSFTINTLRAREPIPEEDWTVERFLEMGRGERVFRLQSPGEMLRYCVGNQNISRFVDYEKKESRFDCEEFRHCLEVCAQTEVYQEGSSGVNSDILHMGGEDGWQLQDDGVSNVRGAVSWEDEDYADKLIGYPGWDGAVHLMRGTDTFAINRNSGVKEGAWDFLEYLLSEEAQAAIVDAFPAREESFEAYVADVYSDPQYSRDMETGAVKGASAFFSTEVSENALEKAQEKVRSMLDSLVMDDGESFGAVHSIVMEEAWMYFSGDSTLDMTVNKIQNRVQTYLDEL